MTLVTEACDWRVTEDLSHKIKLFSVAAGLSWDNHVTDIIKHYKLRVISLCHHSNSGMCCDLDFLWQRQQPSQTDMMGDKEGGVFCVIIMSTYSDLLFCSCFTLTEV